MTADQLARMSDEEKQLRLAGFHFQLEMKERGMQPRQNIHHSQLAFGDGDSFGLFRYRDEPETKSWGYNHRTEWECQEENLRSWSKDHDYLNSLNAIALVEAKLSDSQYTFFASGLDDLVNEADRRSDSLYFVANRTVSATARQRADAILMIL